MLATIFSAALPLFDFATRGMVWPARVFIAMTSSASTSSEGRGLYRPKMLRVCATTEKMPRWKIKRRVISYDAAAAENFFIEFFLSFFLFLFLFLYKILRETPREKKFSHAIFPLGHTRHSGVFPFQLASHIHTSRLTQKQIPFGSTARDMRCTCEKWECNRITMYDRGYARVSLFFGWKLFKAFFFLDWLKFIISSASFLQLFSISMTAIFHLCLL